MKIFFLIISLYFSNLLYAQDSSAVKQKEYLGVLTLTEKYKDDGNWGRLNRGLLANIFKGL